MNPWKADRRDEGRTARAPLVSLRNWRAVGRVWPNPSGVGFCWRVDVVDGRGGVAVDGAAPSFIGATDAAESAAVALARARVV